MVEATTAFIEAKADNPVLLGTMLEVNTRVREKFANLIHADVGEIALLSATSEGENIVTSALDLRKGDNVVIDNLHYDTTFVLYNHLAKTRGIELRIVENVDGDAPLEAFEQHVDERTRLISVSWVSHQNGFRHDLKALAELAHGHNGHLYVDAIQGVGALDLDVHDARVDFLACGTYKWLFAGYGVAAFYVRADLLDEISPDRIGWRNVEHSPAPYEYELYRDARKFEYATPAFAAVYQLDAALDYVLRLGVSEIQRYTVPKANKLNLSLREQGFKVMTPASNESPTLAFAHGISQAAAKRALDDAAIQYSFRDEGAQIRLGVGVFNNDDDIERLLAVTRTWA